MEGFGSGYGRGEGVTGEKGSRGDPWRLLGL